MKASQHINSIVIIGTLFFALIFYFRFRNTLINKQPTKIRLLPFEDQTQDYQHEIDPVYTPPLQSVRKIKLSQMKLLEPQQPVPNQLLGVGGIMFPMDFHSDRDKRLAQTRHAREVQKSKGQERRSKAKQKMSKIQEQERLMDIHRQQFSFHPKSSDPYRSTPPQYPVFTTRRPTGGYPIRENDTDPFNLGARRKHQ